MFDTVRMKAFVDIDPAVFPVGQTKLFMRVDNDTGAIITTYRVRGDKIHHVLYRANSGILIIELSIPKFLYGNNVRMLIESDIQKFWEQLHSHLKLRYGIETNATMWTLERIDVCYNFDVGERVGDYIAQLGNRRISRHDTLVWNQSQTVIFENKTSRITFYDKYQQCIDNDEPPTVVEQANGILRFEITPTRDDMMGHSRTRKACDLLTTGFFDYMTNKTKVRSLLDLSLIVEKHIDFEWLQSQNIQQVERLLGFMALLDMHGETKLRTLYKSPTTFAQRKNLTQTLNVPSAKLLADLSFSNK